MQDNLALLYVNPRQWINLPKEGLFYRIYIYPWYTCISIELYTSAEDGFREDIQYDIIKHIQVKNHGQVH